MNRPITDADIERALKLLKQQEEALIAAEARDVAALKEAMKTVMWSLWAIKTSWVALNACTMHEEEERLNKQVNAQIESLLSWREINESRMQRLCQ